MKNINRRKFIKKSLVYTGATLVGSQLPGILNAGYNPEKSEIFSAGAADPSKAIEILIEAMGGIDKIVKPTDTIGILANSPWKHPGTYTNPDVVLPLLKLCKESGVKKIICFKPVSGYWEKSIYFDTMSSLISEIEYSDERIEIPIPNGLELKKATVFKDFLEVDVFVNIPVAKHHAGTIFSGNLKNLMGVSSSNTNRHMHSPEGEYTYAKHEYLAQCIADLNLIRKPDLCLVDAIECVQNNGPRGPGDTTSPNKILAGTDPVAMDAYSSDLIGFDTSDILTFEMAASHGLGEDDLSKIQVTEL